MELLLIPLQIVLIWHSNLRIIIYPLANCFGLNPNGHCSPLIFDALLFSICLTLLRLLHRLPTLRHSNLRITAHPLANCLACRPPTFLHVPSCFATLQHSNRGLTAHPLANCDLRLLTFFPSAWLCVAAFAPLAMLCCFSFRVSCLGLNPNGHCSPLTFGSLLFSICLTLCPAYLSAFLRFLPAISSFCHVFAIFLHAPPLFMPFLHFPAFFPTFFLPFLRNQGESNPIIATLPSGTCPLKNWKTHPQHHLIARFRATWATSPPHTPYTHFVCQINFARPLAGFRNRYLGSNMFFSIWNSRVVCINHIFTWPPYFVVRNI